MPISKVGSVITETAPENLDRFLRSGVIRADQFAIEDKQDQLKQIAFDASALTAGNTCTVKAGAANNGNYQLPNLASGTLLDVSQAAPAVTYNAPLTGATVTLTANLQNAASLVLEPAGTIAAATVVFPTAPADGYLIRASSTQIITTLTLTAGGADSIVNAVTTIGANGFISYVYRASTTKWYRIG